MTGQTEPVVEAIPKHEIRDIFNRLYLDEVLQGVFEESLRENRHVKSPVSPEPWCTHSQIVIYIDETGQEVARAFQYLRPDGKIGASGKPDPVRVKVGNRIYRAE